MRLSELDYELPEELIAQAPVEPRDASRLLVVDRATATLEDAVFSDLPNLLRADDLIVLNSTRVRAARLSVKRATGGAAEVLLLEPQGDVWQALVRPARKLKPGARLAGTGLEVEIVEVGEAGEAIRDIEGPLPGSGGRFDAMMRGRIIGREELVDGETSASLVSWSFLMR